MIATAVAGWYVYRHRLPLVKVLDAIAPGVLVGIVIVNVAALLTGRNVGLPPQGVPWAVSLWGVPRHPVQFYEALAALSVAGLALWMIAAQPARCGGVGRAMRLRSEPVAAGAVPRAGGECGGSGWAAPGASRGAGCGADRAVGAGSAGCRVLTEAGFPSPQRHNDTKTTKTCLDPLNPGRTNCSLRQHQYPLESPACASPPTRFDPDELG